VNVRVPPASHGGVPVREEPLVFGAPLIGQEEIDEIVDTLRSGWIGFGPKCQRFESEFADYINRPHAVSLSSCTAALQLALVISAVEPGDEVVTTPLTFAATANVIELVGARPVFVDVEPDTQNIDAAALKDALTPRTRAVIPVHMYGRLCRMEPILDLAEERDLSVIEDSAHAVESHRYRAAGARTARFAAFSFYATKNLTTGEGGMLACARPDDADRARSLRLHGLSRDAWQRYSAAGWVPYEVLEPGYKYNMTDLQASLGIHQLARLDAAFAVRERHWAAYDAAFAGLDEVETPAPADDGHRHSRHLYTLILRPELLDAPRATIMSALRAEGVGTGVHFHPLHLHPHYAQKYGYRRGMFPNAEAVGDNTISLPLSARLSDGDVADVITAVQKVIAAHRPVRVAAPDATRRAGTRRTENRNGE
jgi:dTDP-4-amino-4,6-dideoxygalactose transaminase